MEDLLLGPIIGGLSHEGATLWGRAYPTVEDNVVLHAWIGRQADLSDAELLGLSLPLSVKQGFAGVALVTDLQSETHYHYWLTLSAKAPNPNSGPLEGGLYPGFKTFPPAGQQASFSFAFGSCFRPEDENGGAIFRTLENQRKTDNLGFILMLGDQVYADDYKTNSLGKVAETVEEYRKVYEYVWGNHPLRKLLLNLPAFMTLDDHEVDDDWRWLGLDRRKATIPWWNHIKRLIERRSLSEGRLPLARVQAALQAYWEHQGMHAPPLEETLRLDEADRYTLPSDDRGSLAYTFEYGATAFFVMDTRSMRVRSRLWGERTMLGEGQWEQLKRWFLRIKDTHPVKFLVSSCSLLYDSWLDIPRDRWSGYSDERDKLLEFLAENEIEGVYVLSGDLHIAFAIQAELEREGGRRITLWEFCSSPFEQECTQLVRKTRKKVGNKLLKRQDLKFDLDGHNFGVVSVEFDGKKKPKVVFKLCTADSMVRTNTE
jgi:phosphodiesterase/alkaline phosphatase D-like protein